MDVAVGSAAWLGAELRAQFAECSDTLFEPTLVKLSLELFRSFCWWVTHRTIT
jgi:hypothetical protein